MDDGRGRGALTVVRPDVRPDEARRGEARRSFQPMHIFKSGPVRWALEPKKAPILGKRDLERS